MAHKATSYDIRTSKKTGKNFLVLYDNVEPTAAEQKMIDRFISMGYEVRFEEKKVGKTKAEMLEELKNDAEAKTEFEDYYSGKRKMYNKDGTELQQFFAACKVYQAWAKKNKKK